MTHPATVADAVSRRDSRPVRKPAPPVGGVATRQEGGAASDLNRQFHMLTYWMSRPSRLAAFHRAATLYLSWRFYAGHPALCDRCNEQHAEMPEAMRRRDEARVEALRL
ncbi:MAG: FCD domain-containing protein [Acidimicrobiales bacterium]